jgi:diguanylate cyclase (GGDEF)-like protein
MDMISLELNRPESAPDCLSDPIELIEQLQILIRGVALHAMESGSEELPLFQRQASAVADSLTPESSPDDLLVAIGRMLRLTEAYNRHASVIYQGQVEDLRAMLVTMTETVQFIVSSSESSVKQLGLMELQLQRANTLEDLRQLKTYTGACLSLVRRESSRIQAETRAKMTALKSNVAQLSLRLRAVPVEESADPVTGLPGRTAAELAIEDKMSAGREFLVALFVMDRLSTINGRFGHSEGDDVVRGNAHLLAQRLRGATLYRWSGPAFLGVFDPSVPSAEAENRARQAAALQLEKEITADQRMVMIVSSISCHTRRIAPQTALDTVFTAIDALLIPAESDRSFAQS